MWTLRMKDILYGKVCRGDLNGMGDTSLHIGRPYQEERCSGKEVPNFLFQWVFLTKENMVKSCSTRGTWSWVVRSGGDTSSKHGVLHQVKLKRTASDRVTWVFLSHGLKGEIVRFSPWVFPKIVSICCLRRQEVVYQ